MTNAEQPAPGYAYTPAQAQAARVDYIEQQLLPVVAGIFAGYPGLRSALLAIAQYWDDNASDAVHGMLIVSQLAEPDLDRATDYPDEDEDDPNLVTIGVRWPGYANGSACALWDLDVGWDENRGAIPLWAAFAPEGGDQNHDHIRDAYARAVTFHRDGRYEFHDMLRPWLDGIQAEWDARHR